MTKEYKRIYCALCSKTIGFNFKNETNETTETSYCTKCGEAIMNFTNSFKPQTYIIKKSTLSNYDDMKILTRSHNYLINSTHLLYYVHHNQLDELVYKSDEEIKEMEKKNE